MKSIASSNGVRAMPTFMLFKNGSKLAEVVGADIGKVEQLVNTHAAGGSSFPTTGGRTLRDNGSSNAVGGMPGMDIVKNLSPMQQQVAFLAGMLVLFYFLAK
ncbi:hypothetical protein HDU83_002682 [Entophlyctis luteolus]|nr:hypothetical protein HDU82_004584 [Entophlyctis luteolus]KAJ3346737.1 hypothetical protein HDU83_002682 [Entophlyctis luteolus]KAJ3389233.1 hypothetical protein HDU84_008971 [Entophlyctis sp. JEL0112]